jgi:hypothetical protein
MSDLTIGRKNKPVVAKLSMVYLPTVINQQVVAQAAKRD